jgi:hypothetical protein
MWEPTGRKASTTEPANNGQSFFHLYFQLTDDGICNRRHNIFVVCFLDTQHPTPNLTINGLFQVQLGRRGTYLRHSDFSHGAKYFGPAVERGWDIIQFGPGMGPILFEY